MAHYENVLKDGGKVLLVGGSSVGQYPQDIVADARTLIWTDDITGDKKFRPVPDVVKAVVISRAVNHRVAHMILKQAREKKLLILPGFNRSTSEACKIVREMLNHKAVEVKVATELDEKEVETELKPEGGESAVRSDGRMISPRNQIRQFVIQNADLKKPPTEEAKRLFDLSKEYKITTTIGSITQALYKRKRELGFSGTPASIERVRAKPESISKGLLRQIDDSIAAFQLLREHVETLAKENEELKEFKAGIQKKMKEVFGEL